MQTQVVYLIQSLYSLIHTLVIKLIQSLSILQCTYWLFNSFNCFLFLYFWMHLKEEDYQWHSIYLCSFYLGTNLSCLFSPAYLSYLFTPTNLSYLLFISHFSMHNYNGEIIVVATYLFVFIHLLLNLTIYLFFYLFIFPIIYFFPSLNAYKG